MQPTPAQQKALDAQTVVIQQPGAIIIARHSTGAAAAIDAARRCCALGAKLCYPTYFGAYTPAEALRMGAKTEGGAK